MSPAPLTLDPLDLDPPDLRALNRMLGAGVSLVRYALEAEGKRFDATLVVADKLGARHTLRCRDVQNLELLPEGDALSKPMRLEVADLREDKLDRVHFSLEELDRDLLFLHCAELQYDGPGA